MNSPNTHLSHDTQTDPDDLENNFVQTPHLNDLVAARLSRRHFMRGGVSAMAMAGLGSVALSACGGGGDDAPATPTPSAGPTEARLGFSAVGKNTADSVQIAAGYTATVIYATGDPITNGVADYANDGTNNDFDVRAGDHHDGIHFFGLNAARTGPDPASVNRGILCMNHENISGTVLFMHPNGPTAGVRPEIEARKEMDAHGVSVIEVSRTTGAFSVNKASNFNRRITASTLVEISGPVRGTKYVKTKYSPGGLAARGTLNNCGHGYTPWGTYLTAEENWAGYFRRNTGDDANRSAKENAALLRNGIRTGRAGNYGWSTVVPAVAGSTEFSRWNITVDTAQPTDGTGDFRNEANTFGYIVEIDPFDPLATPRKRTAMGRRANEGAWGSLPKAGKPLAFYIGCDSRGEYVYKFVTAANWDPADAETGGMRAGTKYLDQGTIYAGKFNADGTGTWVALDMSNPDVAAGLPMTSYNPSGYSFEDLADICVNTRLAAGAAGATRMDRPEWTAVNPANGEIYITMTENPDRGRSGLTGNNIPNPPLDAANPRAWRDTRTDSATAVQQGNVNGHIIRIRETNDDAGATTFRWDIFLFGSQATPDDMSTNDYYQRNVNLSGLSGFNDLSKPDGCWFSKKSGILWIQTDDGSFTDQTNCMLLAAVPGRHGDGGSVDVEVLPNGIQGSTATTPTTVTTYAGRKMTDATFKRFLVAPKGAEITGLSETPDGKVLFINIQHPGEDTGSLAGPFQSNWPGNGAGIAAAYGLGGASARPRSATLMITKNDGGVIGL